MFWSLVQSWVGRALAALVFMALARLLRPVDFGIAATAFLALNVLSLVTEFGFGDALVQRAELTPEDVNLPFFASVGGAVAFGALGAAASRLLASALGNPGLTRYLAGACALLPLMAVAGFQEALYRRALRFRELAMRTFLGVLAGGAVGIAAALAGLGPWAVIGQFAAQTLTSIACLWRSADWVPSRRVAPGSFRAIAGFGVNLLGVRLVDFATLRSVDLLVLTKFGPIALGLFAVSSRLYQLLMQVFQTSISSVGLSVLSRLAEDRARLRRLLVRSCSISATVGTPVFLALAALAPEVNRLMFGPRWVDAERVMRPLLLIGGLHCIQFTLGAFLTAVGRPQLLFRLMVVKAALVLVPLLAIHAGTLERLAIIYACALAGELPFILLVTCRVLAMDVRALGRPVAMPLAAAVLAFAATQAARAALPLPPGLLARTALLGACFAASDLALIALAPDVVVANARFGWRALRSGDGG